MEKGKVETKMLPVELDEEQVRLRAAKLAETVSDLTSKKNDLERIKMIAKAELETTKSGIEDLTESIERLARSVRDRSELQDVVCEWKRNDLVNPPLMELYRTDTGERVDWRVQTVEERQRPLPFTASIDRLEEGVGSL